MTDKCKYYATVSGSDPRSEIWSYARPDGRIPLKHPLLVKGRLSEKSFYEGDPSRLSNDEKARLVEKLSRKFAIPAEEINKDLEAGSCRFYRTMSPPPFAIQTFST